MFTIENQQLKLRIHPKGAELQSIYQTEFRTEYLWGGDPAFWGKHSPLLFPMVGTLRDNTYRYQGNTYTLPRHGFARDREFVAESQTAESVGLLLTSDADTKKNFPFDFELRVIYHLQGSGFKTTYLVTNPASAPLYFSVGGHPAFTVPLAPGTDYTDYYLEFDQQEDTLRWPISKEGLIDSPPQPLLNKTRTLPLSKDLFARDALVLKHPASQGLALRSKKTERGLKMDYPGFPFLGIWAAPNADFVCLEPWCGIADPVNSNQELTEKEGIQRLGPGESFERSWTLTLF
jgi:galactose mutarotase-like enzyme